MGVDMNDLHDEIESVFLAGIVEGVLDDVEWNKWEHPRSLPNLIMRDTFPSIERGSPAWDDGVDIVIEMLRIRYPVLFTADNYNLATTENAALLLELDRCVDAEYDVEVVK